MGSKYNVKIILDTGEDTYKQLDWLAKDIPIELAQYSIDNNLFHLPG